MAVLVAQRWILGRLRNQTFTSLEELNAAIRDLLDKLNDKITKHLGASRHQLFEQLDKPALKPLPSYPYSFAAWEEQRVGLDYHLKVEDPVGEVTDLLCDALERELDVKCGVADGHLNVNGLTMVSKVLSCDLFQLDLLFPHNFPCVAPIALFSKRKGKHLKDARAIELSWSVSCFQKDALAQKLTPITIAKLKEKVHV